MTKLAVFLSYASPAFAKVYPPLAAPEATRASAGRQDFWRRKGLTHE